LNAQDRAAAPPAYWFSEADAWNVKLERASMDWKAAASVEESLARWKEELGDDVFMYQEQETAEDADGNRYETRPFIFGILPKSTLPLLREALRKGTTLQCDATFGACKRAPGARARARAACAARAC
jgi:hypothetical protein